MNEPERQELLKAEYLQIQATIETFDGRALTIKAWSITFSLSAVGATYATHAWPVLVLAAVSSLMFWTIEGFWKTFQKGFFARSKKIERYFAGKNPDLTPMQIGADLAQMQYIENLRDYWKKGGVGRIWWHVVKLPHVALPHAFVVALSGVLLLAHVIGWVKV